MIASAPLVRPKLALYDFLGAREQGKGWNSSSGMNSDLVIFLRLFFLSHEYLCRNVPGGTRDMAW